jgi:hypothetical protein
MPRFHIFERHVTPTEARKRHITIPARDISLFTAAFGRIHTEAHSKRDPRKGLKSFIRDSDGVPIQLKLVFRNPPRNELRLYFNAGQGIHAGPYQVFYARFEGRKVSLGVRRTRLRKPAAFLRQRTRQPVTDDGDLLNQAFYTEPRYRTLRSRKVPARRLKLVDLCMRSSGYRCEAGFNAPVFLSKKTGKRYLEAHHLVPITQQKQFQCSLDRLENLYALSPHAHRAIHYGQRREARSVIDRLLNRRRQILDVLGITPDVIYRLYGCNSK